MKAGVFVDKYVISMLKYTDFKSEKYFKRYLLLNLVKIIQLPKPFRSKTAQNNFAVPNIDFYNLSNVLSYFYFYFQTIN